MPEKKIQEIEELLGKKMSYTEGIRLKDELELRYNVTITAGPDTAHQPVTGEKVLIFSNYKIKL